MTLPETIRASLAISAAEKDEARLRAAYQSLKESLALAPMADRVGIRTLILCAEAALEVDALDVADECLQTYAVEARRYGPELDAVEVNDQFVVRSGYARAVLHSKRTKHLKGEALIEGTLDCIKELMDVINMAGANDRYTFMIYNGTVHYHHVSRPLQHDGTRSHLVSSLEALTKLLEKVPRQEEWKARNHISLSLCYNEAGKPDDAIKSCQAALDLAKTAGLAKLEQEALALKVHFGQVSGKGGKEAPPEPDAAARAIVQLVLSGGVAEKEAISAQLQEAWEKVDPAAVKGKEAVSETTKGANLEVVADIGWTAALHNCTTLAATCASRASLAKALSPRVRSELTVVKLSTAAAKDGPLAPSTVKAHTAGLKRLELALISLLRLEDYRGIQDCCVLMWNVGLILLQPELRHHVGRAFAAAAAALETIQSPLHRLRAQLHLELAGCSVDSDMLAPAMANVSKGLGLDYTAPKDEVDRAGFERPLDRYLAPMGEVLGLKTDIYSTPEGPFEEALLAVEQARDAKRLTVKQNALERACTLLASLPPVRGTADPPPPEGDDNKDEGEDADADPEARRWAAKRRVMLWGEVVKVAWGAAPKIPALARRAAREALAHQWSVDMDREMVLLQAECSYIDAEAAAADLKSAHEDLRPPSDLETDAAAEGEGAEDALQRAVAKGLLRGMELGNSIGEGWLVTNGAVRAWNMYIHLMRAQQWATLAPLLLAVTDRMAKLEGHEDEDVPMLCHVANAAAVACEHEFLSTRPRGEGEPVAPEGYLALQAEARALGATDKDSKALAGAAAMGEKVIARAPAGRPKRTLVATLARIKGFQGVAAAADGKGGAAEGADKSAHAITLIESLAKPDLTPAQRKEIIQGAMASLRESSSIDVELWAKLGLASLHIGSNVHAIECGKTATSIVTRDPATIRHASDIPGFNDRRWYWLAVAEGVFGQGIVASIRPGVHDYPSQDAMRRLAMEHFLTSARYGSFLGRRDLVDSAARHFWNAALPFMSAPVTRAVLVPGLSELVELVKGVGVGDRPGFLVNMYEVLLEGMADQEAWAAGLKAAEGAFQSVPSQFHKTLWEWKVLFMSKSGRGVQTEVVKIRSYEPYMQARIWANIAPNFPQKYDQLAALQNAVECLKDTPWDAVDQLVDYAEWINTHVRSAEAAEDVLLSAADSLMKIEESTAGGDDATSAGTGSPRSRASRASHITGGAAGAGGGAGGASPDRSVVSKHQSEAGTGGPGSKRGSTKSGGKGPKGPPRPDHLSIMMQGQLVRVFLTLHKISNKRDERADYLLAAQHFAQRVLVGGIESANAAERTRYEQAVEEHAAAVHAAAHPNLVGGGAAKKGGDAKGAKKGGDAKPEVPPPPEPPIQWAVPQGVHEWLEWEPPAGLVEALAADKEDTGMGAMAMPEAFLSVLDLLSHVLQEYGLHVHCIPVVHLAQLVSAAVVKNGALSRTMCLKLCRMLEMLNLAGPAAAAEKRAGSLQISPEEMVEHKQLVAQRLALNAGQGLGAGASDPADGRTSVATIGGSRHVSGARLLEPTTLREIFLARARFLVSRGQYEESRVLLEEALLSAEAFQDLETQGWCKLLLAKLEMMANSLPRAVKLLNEAKALGGEPRYWREVLHTYVQAKLARSDTRLDAKDAINAAVELFGDVARTKSGSAAAELGQVEAHLLQQKADILVDEMFHLVREHRGGQEAYAEAMDAMTRSVDMLQEVGCGPDQVNAFERRAVLVRMDLRPVADERERLYEVRELLAMAERVAEAVYFRAKPPGLPATVSLPAARQLAGIKSRLAEVDLDIAAAAAQYVEEDRAGARPDFPAMAGDPAPVEAYLDATASGENSMGLGPVESAVMASADATALQVVDRMRAAPLFLRGRALQALYLERTKEDPWPPLPKPRNPTPELAEGDEEAAVAADKDEGKDGGKDAAAGADAKEGAAGEGGEGAAEEGGGEGGEGGGAEEEEAAKPEPDAFSRQLERQARESLEEALRKGTAEGDTQTAARAALQLADMCGRKRPEEALDFILQAQSCVQRSELTKVYRAAAEGGGVERLLLQQQDHLRSSMLNPDLSAQGAQAKEQAAVVSDLPQVLDLHESVAEIRASLPPGLRVVSLFLADSRRHMYVAGCWRVTDEERAAADAVAKENETEPVYPTGVVVDRIDVDAEALDRLVAETTAFKRTSQKTVASGQKIPLKRRMSMMMSMRRLSMRASEAGEGSVSGAGGGGAGADSEPPTPGGSALGSRAPSFSQRVPPGEKLQGGWGKLIKQTEALIAPARAALREAAGGESSSVVLLLDFALSVLPWEAIAPFSQCHALSRDFSAHTLNYRLTKSEPEASVSAADVSFIVDLRHEDTAQEVEKQKAAGRKAASLSEEFQSQLAGALAKTGVVGTKDQIPSVGECQRLMTHSKGFLFLGMNRFLAYVPPRGVSGLRLQGCDLAVLADRMTNDSQQRTQAWIDNRKTPEELEVERPHNAAALLSMRGVKSIVMPSMVTTPDDNLAFAGALFKGMGGAGTVGAAVKAASAAVESDLPWAKCNMMVYGLPTLKTK